MRKWLVASFRNTPSTYSILFVLYLERLFCYNPQHVYLAQIIGYDRLAPHIRPS